jgi:hypothetical protein
MFTRRLIAVCVLVMFASTVNAQQPAPQLLSVFPMGAKAGDTVEVTFAGHGFDGSEKLLFSATGFTAEFVGVVPAPKQPQPGQPSTSAKFKVTAPANANGTFDVRVVGKTGLSNPRAFVVGKLKDVSETEPNNDVGPAQKIELETTVNGVISAPTDVDFVTFKAKAGQKITVYCLTSAIDSKLQADLLVSTADGKQLASNRGYRNGDAVLDFQAPTDGDYYVRVSQFAYTSGGYDHFYRLTVTTTPWVPAVFPPVAAPKAQAITNTVIPPTSAMIDATESATILGGNPVLVASNPVIVENEKNNTADSAQAVQVPCDIAGKIAKKAERDWYSFTAKKGDVWTLEVFADRIGSPVDAYFILTDDKGKAITEQDDGADTLSLNQFYTKTDDPGRYRFAVPADGTYKVMVSTREAGVQFGPRDQYVLRIAKETPDFRVAVMPFTPHIPDAGTLGKGGAAVFAVFVFRFDGFADAIELSAENLPKGVACPKQVIGPGQTRGNLVLTATADAAEWDGFVTITAQSGNLKRTARPFTITWPAVNAQQNQVPNTPMITRLDRGDGLALAIRGEAQFTLVPVEKELTAKAGAKVDVTLKITRKDTFKDPIAILAATPGFGPKPQGNQPYPPVGTAPPASNEIKVSVDIPATLASGTHSLVLRAQNGSPPPKGGNNAPLRVTPSYAVAPITVTIEGAPKKK